MQKNIMNIRAFKADKAENSLIYGMYFYVNLLKPMDKVQLNPNHVYDVMSENGKYKISVEDISTYMFERYKIETEVVQGSDALRKPRFPILAHTVDDNVYVIIGQVANSMVYFNVLKGELCIHKKLTLIEKLNLSENFLSFVSIMEDVNV